MIAVLIVGTLGLSGCVGLAVTGATTAGTTIAQERSVGDAFDDFTIRTELNQLFFDDDLDLYQDVSFGVVEGRVLLKGAVPKPEDRIQAVQLAWKAGGVREVINELQVTDEGGIVNFARDTWISTQLKSKILFDSDILSLNYNVETVNGTVYLLGIAQNDTELAKVTGHARTIANVKRVVNHVVLKGDARRQATP
jgi:osmotically-inducible protein OsmY